MFLSCAHTAADIDAALEAADAGFAAVARLG
jgi:glutamate-1-semialdehyde 2,1-aminomutase